MAVPLLSASNSPMIPKQMTNDLITVKPSLSIVIPCYNEEDVLPEIAARLLVLLNGLVAAGTIDSNSVIYFIDDGSSDRTWQLIRSLNEKDSRLRGIKLAANVGHQRALLAGLLSASGDLVISIDADLQDDLEAIPQMIERNRGGADIVYGVRASRQTDSFGKRISAEMFYRILRSILKIKIVFNHADYRLMNRRSLEALRQFPERNLFLRGLVALLGFNTATVEYARQERFAGVSKYPLRRMISLALDGITSFSVAPLRIIIVMGIITSVASFTLGSWALFIALFTEHTVPGWASLSVSVFFIGGIQMLSLGIVGEYVGKIYSETKQRPMYLIEETL